MEEKDVPEEKYIVCYECDGSGYLRNEYGQSYSCPECDGNGEYLITIKKDGTFKTI